MRLFQEKDVLPLDKCLLIGARRLVVLQRRKRWSRL
jgi:hypothetical protein